MLKPLNSFRVGLLDIGVGIGRTTALLCAACQEYVGIDYSSAMVSEARARFPHVDIRKMDARDLSDFADGSFDLVVFSFNGIDYVSHSDRLRILREVRRVLKPDGYFFFSSHNLDYTGLRRSIFSKPIKLSKRPLRVGLGVCRYFIALLNRIYLRRFEIIEDKYCILNDDGLQNTLLTYYISIKNQIDQLEENHFMVAEVRSQDGLLLNKYSNYTLKHTIYYLTRI